MSRKFIALTLKKLREESGLTANEVGARIGKSGKTVNAWENDRGQPDVDTLFKLCELYGVDDIASVFSDNFQEISALHPLTDEEALLIQRYRELNAEGQEKLLDYADDLAASGRYKKDFEALLGKAE